MKALKDFIRKKNMLFKIILSYVLVGFLFIGAFSYVILNKVSENMTAEINETSSRMIDQSYNTADILLTSTYNYFSQVFTKNEMIYNAMYGKNLSQIQIYKINSMLDDFTLANPLVSSIYVYNFNSGLIFSSASVVSTFVDFFDADMSKMLLQKGLSKQGIFIPRLAHLTFPGNSYNKNLISVVYSNSRPNGNQDGVMILNLDQNVLQELVTKGSGEATHKMMIVNNEGLIISHPDGMFLNENETNPAFLRTVLEAKDKRGRMLSSIDGTKYMISYVKSDRLGWSFVSMAEYDKLLSKVNTLKRFIIWVTGLCLASMAVTSAFFTRIIYVPIYHLIKRTMKAATEPKEQTPLSEYDLLNKSFSLLENKVNTLQSDVNQSVPMRKQNFLRSLLHGTIGKGTDFRQSMKQLGIGFDSGRYLVCVLKIDAFHELSEKYDMVDISLLKYAIENISSEIGSVHYKLETLEDGHDSFDLIFNVGHDGETNNPAIESLLRDIQFNVEKFLKITVTASIGPVVDRIEELKYSRQGAYQAAHYRLIYGRNSLISYSDIIAVVTNDYQHPVAMEKQIMDSLKAGELERLQELYAEFISAIHPFSYDEIFLSLVQLLVMTIRTAKGMASFDSEDADLEIHTCQQQLLRLETLEQIETWYFRLCERIVAIRERQSQTRNKKAVDKMKSYIHEHYMDSNLTVDMLAKLIGLTVDYFRRLFKEETGQSVSGYIAELRFLKAEELLILTDHPVNKIGELVGFDNTRYFYSLFKKRFGKTPDHYRKDNKLKNIM